MHHDNVLQQSCLRLSWSDELASHNPSLLEQVGKGGKGFQANRIAARASDDEQKGKSDICGGIQEIISQ